MCPGIDLEGSERIELSRKQCLLGDGSTSTRLQRWGVRWGERLGLATRFSGDRSSLQPHLVTE